MALSVKAFSFAKSTSVTTQARTDPGFTPKALMLFSSGGLTAGTARSGFRPLALGFATATEAFAASAATIDGATDSDTSRRLMAKAWGWANWAGTLQAEAGLSSMDASGFTLDWTTNNADATLIHGLALGGADLTNAKVVRWQMPTSSGAKAVTGVGFQPDLCLHLSVLTTGGTGVTASDARWMLGATDGTNQWAHYLESRDGLTDTDSRSIQLTDSCILATGVGSSTTEAKAAHTSLDSDGFTVNFSTAPASAYEVVTLCLKGGRHKVGATAKPTGAAPATHAITGIGFTPQGYLLAGINQAASASQYDGIRYAIGGSDGTTELANALVDVDAAATSNSDNLTKTTKVAMKVDTMWDPLESTCRHASLSIL